MNQIGELLLSLATQVRSRTLWILDNAEPAWLMWRPTGTSNHLAWHAGHVFWVQEELCIAALGGRPEIPGEWVLRFAMGSRPALDPGPWPAREELASALQLQFDRMKLALAGVDPAQLGTLNPMPGEKPGPGWEILHGLHDEAIHQGEMWMLLTLCRARRNAQSLSR